MLAKLITRASLCSFLLFALAAGDPYSGDPKNSCGNVPSYHILQFGIYCPKDKQFPCEYKFSVTAPENAFENGEPAFTYSCDFDENARGKPVDCAYAGADSGPDDSISAVLTSNDKNIFTSSTLVITHKWTVKGHTHTAQASYNKLYYDPQIVDNDYDVCKVSAT